MADVITQIPAAAVRFQTTKNSADATSPVQVQAGESGKQIYIMAVIFSTDTALNIKLQDDAGSPEVLMEPIYLAANGGFVMNWPKEAPLVVDSDRDLDMLASIAGNVTIQVTGYIG